METPIMTIWTLFALIGMLLLGGVVFGLWVFRKQQQIQNELRQEMNSLKQILNGLCSGAVGVDRRITRLEQHEKELLERQEQLQQEQTQSHDQPYGDAIQHVRQGLPVDSLVEKYGFSRTEADLLVHLHGIKQAS